MCMIQSLYHLSDQEVKDLTLKEFYIKQKNIPEVAKLYNPYIGEEDSKTGKNKKPVNRKDVTYGQIQQFIKKKV